MDNPEPTRTGGVETVFSTDHEFKGAVIGMILGDGYLGKDKRDKGHCCVEIVNKDFDYIKHKESLLNYLTSCTITIREGDMGSIRGESFNSGLRYRLRSKRHPLYTKLWERFYYQGRKTIDEYLLNTLTPNGLALWFMDDGSTHNRKIGQNRCANPASYYVFYTNSFNYVEHKLIQRILAKRFDIQTNIQGSKGGNELQLYVQSKSTNKFLELIEPYIIPSMQYKIGNNGRVALQQKVMRQSDTISNDGLLRN